MKKLSLLFVASALAIGSAYACGGEDAKNPNDVASASASATTSAAPSASADVTPSATASVTATASTPPPPPEAPPLAIDGIKITGKTKEGKPVAVEVKADGSVNGTKDGKAMVLATFAKNEIKDDKGALAFSVAADGKVTSPALGGSGTMSFNDKDELVVDGKPAITIGDDGVPTLTNGTKTEKAPFKFEKLPPKSKRAAVLLVAYMLLARASSTPPTAVSVSPGPSAKPPTTPSAKPSAAPSAAPKK